MQLIPDHGKAAGRPWVMEQTWSRLLFAHWSLSASVLRPLIPMEFEIDTYEDQAFVGVVPFYMSEVRFRGLPSIPSTRNFCELNVRTYVKHRGIPAVWFFSLDASSTLAVWGARIGFHLPYYSAHMQLAQDHQVVSYRSERWHPGAQPAIFEGQYHPTKPLPLSQPGSLEYWLTERYSLYAYHRKQIYRGDIDHQPWPLQGAEADITHNTMAQAAGIPLPDAAPLLHYVERISVRAWYLRAIP